MIFKRTLIIACLTICVGNMAMDRLPGDIIRTIAKSVLHASGWTDSDRAFGLQSMASVNHHWNASIAGLARADFPYQCEQAAASIMVE